MSDVISGGKTVTPDREPLVSKQIQTIYSHAADIMSCDFSKDYLLAICSSDKLARLWVRKQAGEQPPDPGAPPGLFVELPQSPLYAHSYAVNFCQFSPDGNFLATCSQDGRAILWDVKTGKKHMSLQHGSSASVRVGAFSPDGEYFATGCDDDTVGLWAVRNGGRLVKYLEGHECSIVALAFTPDSAYLVTGATDGDIWIWDARHGAGRFINLLDKAHDLGVNVAIFSPQYGNGMKHLLASAGNDDALKLWRLNPTMTGDAETSLYADLTGHSSNIMCLAFRPDGQVLASGSGDKTIILWDPLTGGILGRIVHHHRYVTCCAFSPDGSLLVTGSNDKTAVVWEVGPPSLIDFSDEDHVEAVEFGKKGTVNHRDVVLEPIGSRRCLASDWSPDQVADWISSLGLHEYRGAFIQHAIDGQELLFLTDQMLKKSIGIEALGHRNKVLRSVASLKNNSRHFDNLGYQRQRAAGHVAMERSRSLQANGSLLKGSDLDKSASGNPQAHEFYCPITHELMTDPVVAADGYTYERRAINAWIQSGKHSSPMTNAPLHHLDLVPNRSLKMLIQKSTG